MPSTRIHQFQAEAPSMRALRCIIVPAVAVFVVLAMSSGYRAVWQVRRLDILTSHDVLAPGDTVGFVFESWGRVEADAQLDVVQGAVAETLAVKFLPRNRNASLDPRPQRTTATVVLTPTMLSRFRPGPAMLRATGYGSMQWLRTPPPAVRRRRVRLAIP